MFNKLVAAKAIGLVVIGGALGTALDQRRDPRIKAVPMFIMVDQAGVIHQGAEAKLLLRGGMTAPIDATAAGYWEHAGVLARTAKRKLSSKEVLDKYFKGVQPPAFQDWANDAMNKITGKTKAEAFNNPIKEHTDAN